MIVSVVNHSASLLDEEVQAAISAINRQLQEHVRPYWHLDARLRLEGRSMREPSFHQMLDLRGDAVLYLWDQANLEDALGYHDRNARGVPFGFVFTEVSRLLDEPWSVTLSHEALEMVGDPFVNRGAWGPHPRDGHPVEHWFELCDACQSQYYEIDMVSVSDFVLPLYFTGGEEFTGRNDYLGTGLRSFGINEGGYVGFFDPRTGQHDTVAHDERGKARMQAKAGRAIGRRALRMVRA